MASRILIIDDNPINLELMAYLLESYGHGILRAGDGEAGLEVVKRELPDLVICDVHLPKMDGHELARRLKQSDVPALRLIPLVAVTALAMSSDQENAIAAGFDGYISKPIVPESFVRQIESFMPEIRG